MPDEPEKPCPCSWMDKAKAIVLVIGAIGGLIASTTAAIFSGLNHGQTEKIETKQVENAAKLDAAAANAAEAKETVERHATKADGRLKNIEAKIK